MTPRGRPPSSDAVIVGVGARTPFGLTALQVTMSARAHRFAPRASHVIDRKGNEIATARLMSIGDDVFGLDRLVALGGPALTQAAYPWLSAVSARAPAPPPLPAFVALPGETRPGLDPRIKGQLLRALEARARVPLDHQRSRLVFGCRGGGVTAFEHALAELRRGDCQAVVVGGVDSYFDPDALEHLDRELRLHSLDTENGFIPGEGAGFVVLARRHAGRSLHQHGQVLSAATEREPRPYGSEEPCLGLGVTLAVKRAVEAAGTAPRGIPWALTDVANERHRVDEWQYAAARNHLAFTEEARHDQPLLKTGDLGAASAAVLVVMAATRWDTGCAPGDVALVVTHSDGAERGAMVIGREGSS